jgi:hypothetical protein
LANTANPPRDLSISDWVAVASAAVAFYAATIGFGAVVSLGPLTYFADEWYWLSLGLDSARSNICKLLGHPFVGPNLHLYLNYRLLDASALARSLGTAISNVAGMTLIAHIVVAGTRISFPGRIAIYVVFGSVGLSCSLAFKIYWSIGISDATVTIGAALSVLGPTG